MFHPTEPRVIAVLDWELSTLGHPLADLGFCVMPWLTAPEEYGGILGTPGKRRAFPRWKSLLKPTLPTPSPRRR
ncbi:MAG: phosphotransferase [Thalassovita mediterranea]|uniref:phosphotransferase n=1 Tax=Thalassovita mediterranea TaxID=340021 RepID=UPI003C42C03F